MTYTVYGRMSGKAWTKAASRCSFLEALRFAIECDAHEGWWDETLIWPDDGTRPEGHRGNGRDRRPVVEVPVV